MKKIFYLFIILFGFKASQAQQNIGINTNTPDSSAILDIQADDKGILIPRLTSVERLAIPNPANSLLVFDVTEDALFFYSDSVANWLKIPNKSEVHWNIKNNNIYKVNAGYVGIGTDNPLNNLHIKGDSSQPAGIRITNGDSTYSVIIVIDINEDGIIVKGDDNVNEKLLYQILNNGKFGLGTKPNSLMHLKPQPGIIPQLQISNEDSSYNIIIVIDINEDGIVVKGNDVVSDRTLYAADKIGRFAVGTSNARNVLELYSDTINPSIRMSRANGVFDYVMGFSETSTEFILERDSAVGGSASILVVDSAGDVNIYGKNNISLSPKLTTGSIELNDNSNSVMLSIDNDGNLSSSSPIVSPSAVGTKRAVLELMLESENIAASDVYPDFESNTLDTSVATIYNFSIGADTIEFMESGTYHISYNLNFSKNTTTATQIACSFNLNGADLTSTRVYEYMAGSSSLRYYTSNCSKIIELDQGDVLKLVIDNLGYSSNDITLLNNSNISIYKLAD
jgi:hypothetical protein